MSVFSHVEAFLLTSCSSSAPVLLALSGGPDSLCLFYCLLTYRSLYPLPFHIAHVDHGWRQESQEEAQILQQLALRYHVPFHLKTLNPTLLKGNLEAACREERYAFFAAINQQIEGQGVLIAHHQEDQAETIFKRVVEGAHWSRWKGLQLESWREEMRILRPLLGVSKKNILHMLTQQGIEGFDDPTNQQEQFLRARLRHTIFPWLNQHFGKQVQQSFIEIGEEAQDLIHYFETRLTPILKQQQRGPWGIYLDLQIVLPTTLLEIKYLLRLLCSQQQFFLSRELIKQIAQALQAGKAHQLFVMGGHSLWVDRHRIFIVSLIKPDIQIQKLQQGDTVYGEWSVQVKKVLYSSQSVNTSWKEGWKGHLKHYLPLGDYTLYGFNDLKYKDLSFKTLKKRWNQAKVPTFLFEYFPLLLEERGNCHECLTGHSSPLLKEGMPCWKVEIDLLSRNKIDIEMAEG